MVIILLVSIDNKSGGERVRVAVTTERTTRDKYEEVNFL